jgi:hypothetical protein
MKSETRTAPFTDDEVRILKLWQANDYMHPFTCCDHQPMEPTNEGMKCLKCGRLQEWVHDFMLKESAATYNPFKDAKFKEEDSE